MKKMKKLSVVALAILAVALIYSFRSRQQKHTYFVIQTHSSGELRSEVERAMENGYQPAGGVGYWESSVSSQNIYTQAMYK